MLRYKLAAQPSEADYSIDEWKEARSVLARLDGNLHDLRKYGFSFITALLAANSLIGQGTGGVTIPSSVKLVIFIITLGLIVGLRVLDTNYTLFQQATSMRARILEKRLNLDITQTISRLFFLQTWWVYIQWLYLAFVALTTLLGLVVLYPNGLDMLVMVVAGVVSAVIVRGIHGKKLNSIEDWTLDRKVISGKAPLRITLTNLVGGPIKLPKGEAVWKIVSYSGELQAEFVPEDDIVIDSRDGYDWLWDHQGSKAGLYRFLYRPGYKSLTTIQILDTPTAPPPNPAAGQHQSS